MHKGYPTAAHLRALREHGACPAHRRSFGPVRAFLYGGADYPQHADDTIAGARTRADIDIGGGIGRGGGGDRGGADKTGAIRAVLESGRLRGLITDEPTAQALAGG